LLIQVALSFFQKIELLHILHLLYPDVLITPEVADEFAEPLPEWINIQSANPINISLFENIILELEKLHLLP
jgi:predicted nucleic acid-binding protein